MSNCEGRYLQNQIGGLVAPKVKYRHNVASVTGLEAFATADGNA